MGRSSSEKRKNILYCVLSVLTVACVLTILKFCMVKKDFTADPQKEKPSASHSISPIGLMASPIISPNSPTDSSSISSIRHPVNNPNNPIISLIRNSANRTISPVTHSTSPITHTISPAIIPISHTVSDSDNPITPTVNPTTIPITHTVSSNITPVFSFVSTHEIEVKDSISKAESLPGEIYAEGAAEEEADEISVESVELAPEEPETTDSRDLNTLVHNAIKSSNLASFSEVIRRLGTGITEKYNALLHIKKNVNKYIDLMQIPGFDFSMVDQAIEFIRNNAPNMGQHRLLKGQGSSLEKDAKNTLGNIMVLVRKNEVGGLSKKMPVLPHTYVCSRSKGFSSALQLLLTIPEICNDLKRLSSGTITRLAEDWTLETSNNNKLYTILATHRIPDADIAWFFKGLSFLSTVIRGIVKYNKKNSLLEKCENELESFEVWLCETAFVKEQLKAIGEDTSKASWCIYRILYTIAAIFYEISYEYANRLKLEGTLMVRPDTYYRSKFSTGDLKYQSEYTFMSVIPKALGALDEFSFKTTKDIKLEYVQYFDNEEQVRKIVMIPKSQESSWLLEHIISYISQLYNKPEKNIHPFFIDPTTSRWSCLARDSSLKTALSDRYVFYYIKEADSLNSAVQLQFVSLTTFSKGKTSPLKNDFPVFLGKFMVESLALAGYKLKTENCPMEQSMYISSLEGVNGILPHIYEETRILKGDESYSVNFISTDNPYLTSELGLYVAMNSLEAKLQDERYCPTQNHITYYTRDIERGQYYSVYAPWTLTKHLDPYNRRDIQGNELKSLIFTQDEQKNAVGIFTSTPESCTARLSLFSSRSKAPETLEGFECNGNWSFPPEYRCHSMVMHPSWRLLKEQAGIRGRMMDLLLFENQ
ncbi:uncharacterized protein NEMAJ01_1887 [Nematocida major]|uniref:uncharacterized protein n=1 Tax=Nematocida major TaxID=1912982 RepID=UPI00200789AC|nr:uncharacterized protein NEMAJ01_1887 [Nematocida major]KAH9386991.1 hypothetical protein NEMAJ01_1887 [Nematocida major]